MGFLYTRLPHILPLFLLAAFAFGADEPYPVDADLGFSTSPAVGETIPEFTLPDQNGVLRSVRNLVGDNGAILNFNRSASWRPCCKKELVQFQGKIDEFDKKSVTVIGISYDKEDSNFAAADFQLPAGEPFTVEGLKKSFTFCHRRSRPPRCCAWRKSRSLAHLRQS